MADNLRTQLEELAGIVANCEAGVIRANAKGELATLVVNNLPTILAALDAVEWRSIADDPPPQDGTVILCYRPDAGLFTAHYVEEDAHLSTAEYPPEGDCYWFTTGGEDLTDDMPTHWRPLGPLPEGE